MIKLKNYNHDKRKKKNNSIIIIHIITKITLYKSYNYSFSDTNIIYIDSNICIFYLLRNYYIFINIFVI